MAVKMDTNIDPCQDFAKYACGNYYRNTIIPDDQSRESAFSMLDRDVKSVLRKVLQEDPKTDDVEYVTKMKQYYKMCMDEDEIEQVGLQPFLDLDIVKRWPTLSPNWDDAGLDLNGILEKYAEHFETPLVGWFINSDQNDSDKRRLNMYQPRFPMDSENLKKARNSSVLMAYEEYIEEVSVILGANRTTAKQDAKDVVDFQATLAKIFMPKEKRINKTYTHNPSTLAKMSQDYGQIDYHRLIQASFRTVGKTIPQDYEVNIYSPDYFEDLKSVINATDKRIMMNSFGFSFADGNIGSLTKALREASFKLSKVKYGTKTPQPRWKFCISGVGGRFGYGLSKKYVQEAFQAESKAYVKTMVDNLIHAFGGLIEDSSWMGAETKKAALIKLHAMKNRIGYPDDNFEVDDIIHSYENHTITPGEYYKTYTGIGLESISKLFRDIDLPVDKTIWARQPYEVNAFYSPTQNSINFLAAILQPPAFSIRSPNSLNYGAIGMVIGHEITHGFDQSGAQFDAQGNVHNWWQPEDLLKFKTKNQCIIDQYSAYKVEEVNMNLNGEYSAGENAADIGGIKESFRAYKTYAATQPKELPLPALGLTPDQQFFLSHAQFWCTLERPDRLRQQILGDPHAPARFRIIGPLSNSEDFVKAYKCPAGSFMNPVKKCGIW